MHYFHINYLYIKHIVQNSRSSYSYRLLGKILCHANLGRILLHFDSADFSGNSTTFFREWNKQVGSHLVWRLLASCGHFDCGFGNTCGLHHWSSPGSNLHRRGWRQAPGGLPPARQVAANDSRADCVGDVCPADSFIQAETQALRIEGIRGEWHRQRKELQFQERAQLAVWQ